MDLWDGAAIVSSGILDKFLRVIGGRSLEGILDLVPIGIREQIPEGITEGELSCGWMGISIPDDLFKKEFLGKTFSILFPDLINIFSS